MEISSFFITSSIMIVVTLFKKSDSKGCFFLNQGREVQDIYMNILSPVL